MHTEKERDFSPDNFPTSQLTTAAAVISAAASAAATTTIVAVFDAVTATSMHFY